MTLIEIYRNIISGYYGIELVDDYNLKVYVLKDIENYINEWLIDNDISEYNLEEEKNYVFKNRSELEKLQDALLVLQKINGPIELIIMIKRKIIEIQENH